MFDEQILKNFIGHTGELALFEHWLTDRTPGTPWILFFHDATDEKGRKGGVGKTWLLKKCAALAQEQHSDIAVVMVDFFSVADRDAVVIVQRMVDSLHSVYPDWLPASFEKALAEYQEGFGKSSDLSDIQDTMYEALANDLSTLDQYLDNNDKRLLLFFDTFEVIEDHPITAILGGNHTFPENFGFSHIGAIIAGRNAPDWQHANWQGREHEVRTVPIEPFTLEEMVHFVNENSIVSLLLDSEQAQVLHRRTQGRPILIGLVTDVLNHRIMSLPQLLNAKSAQFEEYLVLQINNLERPINWVVLFMSHIYHRFNETILNWLFNSSLDIQELIQDIDTERLAGRLLELSFVRHSGSGDNVVLHDEMRRLVDTYNWNALGVETQDYRKVLSRGMINYYENVLQAEQNQQLRQAYIVEMTYHMLVLDIEKGFDFFADRLKRAVDLWQTAFARALFQEASKFQEALSRYQRLRLRRYEALLLRKEENSKAALKIYEELEQRADADWLEEGGRHAEITLEKGYCYLDMSRFPEAVQCFNASLQFERARGNERRQAAILSRLGYIYRRIGELDQVESYYLQCQSIYKKLGERKALAEILNSLGNFYRLRGKFDEALRYCTTALRMRRELYALGNGSEVSVGLSLSTLGTVYLRLSDFARAQQFFERAYEIFERNRYKKGVAGMYNRFGQIAIEQNNLSLAMDWHRKGYQASVGIDVETEINSLNKQGRALILLHQPDDAIARFEEAIQRAQQVSDYYQQTESLIDLTETFTYTKRYERAQECLRKAEDIAVQYKYYYLLGEVERLRAGSSYETSDYKKAFEHYGRYCYYMALYNPVEYGKAVRYVTEELQRLPSHDMISVIENLVGYWETLELKEEHSPMLNALAEVNELMYF